MCTQNIEKHKNIKYIAGISDRDILEMQNCHGTMPYAIIFLIGLRKRV